MTATERHDEAKRAYFKDFLRDRVFVDKDLGTIDDLEIYMARHKEDSDTWNFCYFLDLGTWFEEALDLCSFDVSNFLAELRSDWEKDSARAAKDFAEIDRDLRKSQGWPH